MTISKPIHLLECLRGGKDENSYAGTGIDPFRVSTAVLDALLYGMPGNR
jgi:hypothetical protein